MSRLITKLRQILSRLLALLLFIACLFSSLLAQTFVNKEWSYTIGEPDSLIDWSATATKGTDVVVVGNTQSTTQGSDVLITKFDEDGVITWQEEYSASGDNDYGVDVVIDDNDDIFICAASYDGSSGTSDFLILKYTSDGTNDWDYTYDGSGSDDDIPTSITLDASGNVYVTGLTTNSSGDYDFATIKLDTDGTHEWTEVYDYDNESDIPAAMAWHSESGDLLIVGGSGTSSTNWDYLTIRYETDGTLVDEETVTNPGFGFDKPADMAVDAQGNIYITGSASQNGTDYDIYTVKLDTGLSVVWDERYGTTNLEDAGLSIAVDDQGNSYVAGFTGADSITQFTIISYDDTGAVNWNKKLYPDPVSSSIAKKIGWHPDGYLVVSGEYSPDSNSTSQIVTVGQETTGDIKWQINYEQANILPGTSHQMSINDDGDIFVTGITLSGPNSKYLTASYSAHEFNRDFALDSASSPVYLKDQIIISFYPDALILDDFETNKIHWGDLDQFVKASVISDIETKIGRTNIGTWKAYKVHRNLTRFDSTSTTRLGRVEKLLPLWTSLVVESTTPPSSFTYGYEKAIVDSLNTMTDDIRFAHLNFAVEPDIGANDTYYASDMPNLHPTTSLPNGHITVEDAWDIETGQDHVKVGIIDSGIRWAHEDFGDGTFSGSRIKGGWDYHFNQPIDNSINHDADGHGTAVAGIIGAIRNNSLGIAGIAGGDDSQSIPGVQLFSFRTYEDGTLASEFADIATSATAIVEAALDIGYECHILNNSYGYTDQNPASELSIIEDAVYTAWRNDVLLVASRGNDGVMAHNYPATFKDDWIVSVGGSDEDGNYLSWSSYGLDMDLCAPGNVDIVKKTTGHSNNSAYRTFGGTSSSAPHVAGVASLMLSHVNTTTSSAENLAPEDVEWILQENANDRVDPGGTYGVGYDDYTGHGLVDAAASLQAVEKPYYKILHFDAVATSSDVTLLSTNSYYAMKSGPLNSTNLAGGTYVCDFYKVEVTNSHSIGTNFTLQDYWQRNNASDLMGSAGIPEPDIEVTQCNATQATLVGYAIHVKTTLLGASVDEWIPHDPFSQSSNLAYSLYVFDGSSVDIDDDEILIHEVKVIPNPSSGMTTVSFTASEPSNCRLQILDLNGRNLYSSELIPNGIGQLEISFDMSSYARGIYIGKLEIGAKTFPIKVYKQ